MVISQVVVCFMLEADYSKEQALEEMYPQT